MKLIRNLTHGLAVTTLAAAFLLVSGCSNTPLQSSQDTAQSSSADVQLLTRSVHGKATAADALISADLASLDETEWMTTSGLITRKKGGILFVGDRSIGFSIFYVPRRSVPEDTEITMRVSKTGACAVEFEPEGLVFDRNPTVYVSYVNTGVEDTNLEAKLKLFYHNVDMDTWELVEGSHADKKYIRVIAKLQHFSRYAIGGNR